MLYSESELAELGVLKNQLLKFRDLLHEEYQALRKRNLDALENLTAQKNDLLEQMSPNQELTAKLTRSDHGTNKNTGAEIANELVKLISDCEYQNQVNGGALEACQAFTASLLDVLHQREPRSELYNARGRRLNNTQSGATLVSA